MSTKNLINKINTYNSNNPNRAFKYQPHKRHIKLSQSAHVDLTQPDTISAYSYDWWQMLVIIKGEVFFNSYRYSVTTAKHQSALRAFLSAMKISYSELPMAKGFQDGNCELETACRELGELRIKLSHSRKKDQHTKRRADKLEKAIFKFASLNDIKVKEVKDRINAGLKTAELARESRLQSLREKRSRQNQTVSNLMAVQS